MHRLARRRPRGRPARRGRRGPRLPDGARDDGRRRARWQPSARRCRAGAAPGRGRAPARRSRCRSVYDGEDLPEVGRLTGLAAREVVAAAHRRPSTSWPSSASAPGFPYLVGLDPALHVPRRATPRTVVPAGCGRAGRATQTGVYPTASPGGWQLIGRTERRPVRPHRATRRRCSPRATGCGSWRRRDRRSQRPGLLTTVQDLGRPGLAHLGVPHRRGGGPARPTGWRTGWSATGPARPRWR